MNWSAFVGGMSGGAAVYLLFATRARLAVSRRRLEASHDPYVHTHVKPVSGDATSP